MFFSDVTPFPEVKDGQIDIIPFLEASKEVVRFVELLGSIFSPIKHDVNGNIEKLYKIQKSNEVRFITLNDIIEFEMNETEKIGIDALLWLKRGLEYVHVFLTCLTEDNRQGFLSQNLAPYFYKAYEEKLKPYHGWIVQKLFALIVHAAPSRKSLFQILASGNEAATEDEILKDIDIFSVGLGKNLDVINSIYQELDIDSDAKV